MNDKIADEVVQLAKKLNWNINSVKKALTGSIYIELQRYDEYVIIRISNHKMIYKRWFTIYSLSPGDLFYEQIELILKKPYGTVGDIITK